ATGETYPKSDLFNKAVQLVKQRDIIAKMLRIYIDQLLQGLSHDRITRIQKLLIGKGALLNKSNFC
ncbi:hypothetical protein LMJ16_26050, partial [Klebsiella pneumoniae]|nr:hypothetical protein [Klebsiella pneumoniae]